MPKAKTAFVCQSCGTAHVRWQGRCEGCGEWNSIVEELVDSGVGAGPKMATAGGRPVATGAPLGRNRKRGAYPHRPG